LVLFYGSADGVGSAAGFSGPVGITTDGSSLFVADTASNLIRKIAISTGAVTTIAGGGSGYNASCSLNYAKPGSLDGTGLAASFSTPNWISSDGTNLYISDQANRKIRKLVIATGVVTTLAGSGVSGYVDGAGSTATFSSPQGITTDGTNLYVVDGSKIRIVSINTGTVTTLALDDLWRSLAKDHNFNFRALRYSLSQSQAITLENCAVLRLAAIQCE
jgi:sugar lactone lactonase YvrE